MAGVLTPKSVDTAAANSATAAAASAAAAAASAAVIDLTAPDPIGSVTPNTGVFTTLGVGGSPTGSSGALQVTGDIGLTGNTEIRQSVNADGSTLKVFATQVVAGGNNSQSYSYVGGALLAAQHSGDSAVLLDAGRHLGLSKFTAANTALSEIEIKMTDSAGTKVFGVDSATGNVDIPTGTVKTAGYTVATLPAGTVGMRAYVTDATTPTFLGALTGGGAVVCPVFYNGTAWVSG